MKVLVLLDSHLLKEFVPMLKFSHIHLVRFLFLLVLLGVLMVHSFLPLMIGLFD